MYSYLGFTNSGYEFKLLPRTELCPSFPSGVSRRFLIHQAFYVALLSGLAAGSVAWFVGDRPYEMSRVVNIVLLGEDTAQRLMSFGMAPDAVMHHPSRMLEIFPVSWFGEAHLLTYRVP